MSFIIELGDRNHTMTQAVVKFSKYIYLNLMLFDLSAANKTNMVKFDDSEPLVRTFSYHMNGFFIIELIRVSKKFEHRYITPIGCAPYLKLIKQDVRKLLCKGFTM